MLTEDEARDLLKRAASTIEVPPGDSGTVRVRRHTRLIPLLAAAAVVAIVAGAVLLIGNHPDAADHRPTPSASGSVRVPSVFAHDEESATKLLTSLGLRVRVVPDLGCRTPGRATRTHPRAGALVERGGTVKLYVTRLKPAARCLHSRLDALAWRLLDFANGRGPAPDFAPHVDVYVNGRRTVMTAAAAADPDTWTARSALGILAAQTRQIEHRGNTEAPPVLDVHHDDGTEFVCNGLDLPHALAGRGSLWFDLELPSPGPMFTCTFANVYRTDGRIDAIVVRSTPVPAAKPDTSVPVDPDGVGARFWSFARRKGTTLPVDTSVRLYLNSAYEKTVEPSRVSDRKAWDMCAGATARSCPISPLGLLDDLPSRPAVTGFLPRGCVSPGVATRPPDAGGNHLVVLGVPEPRTCADDFEVEVWSNDEGEITAVDVILGAGG